MIKKSSAFFAIAISVFSLIFALLTPVQGNNLNLEPLSAFYADMNGAASSYTSLDYTVTHNGNPSIRCGPDYVRRTREVDGAWITVNPGDHIYFSCWAKTGDLSNPDQYRGLRIGFDYYVNSSQYGSGVARYSNGGAPGRPSATENSLQPSEQHFRLPWGNDWTLLYWDIIVPTETFSYQEHDGQNVAIPETQINALVAIFDVRETDDNAYAWFSDPTLNITPASAPSPAIDNLVVLFSLLFNIYMIFVFVFRGQRNKQSKAKWGPLSNLLLIPFSSLWLLNLLNTSDLWRLITLFPVIVFLGYNLWFRTATKRKTEHHSENLVLGNCIYLLLYVIGGIMLNGYAFLVSLPIGFAVVSSYCCSLMAYGYFQHYHKKLKRR